MCIKVEHKDTHHPLSILEGDNPPRQILLTLKTNVIMEKSNNIVNSWSFVTFVANNGGKAFLAPFVDSKTGESFSSIVCKKSNDRNEKGTIVNFSSKLGNLSLKELAAQKDELQVVQLVVDPEILAKRKAEGRQLESYKLCKVGESSWQELDLGI